MIFGFPGIDCLTLTNLRFLYESPVFYIFFEVEVALKYPGNLLNGSRGKTNRKLKIHQTNMFYTWLDAKLLFISEKKYFKE